MVKNTKSSEKWEQLLASAIITPNSFVVPNEILNEIFIALSGIRSLPVLEAKQSLSVGLLVFENWTNQIETESFPPLVFGAVTGDAWETISSLVSTLVFGATFKIKLAYIKTAFQSIHGFLGAKSVFKNNMKLFCVKFAFQSSLDAAFLVEFTSFICLATLKIAKFLVVSESGSSSVTVVLYNVSLDVSAADIKSAFEVFGEVFCVMLKPASVWQYVVVYFKELDAAAFALTYWSILNETILFCNQFKAKLVGGQTCFISCLPDSGHCFWFALVIFGSQVDLDFAVETLGCQHCFRCQEIGHVAVDCKVSLPPSPKTPKMFKSHFMSSVSYAKASASLNSSEFSLLVTPTSPSMVVSNSVMSFQLAFVEFDLVKLSVLIESIVKPIGFLVKLFEQFINGDLVLSSKLGFKVNEVIVHLGTFSKIVGKLGREMVSLKKECCIKDIDMFSNSEHSAIDVKANALKTAK
ncbi:hypothetical protein G9A89_008617 [Geosiphon pyriformis]|nr:hypothetical protein G9A89_008617 [Geosiphon pyriformis]